MTSSLSSLSTPISLQHYDIDPIRGFLRTNDPVTRLPPYYAPWEHLISSLTGRLCARRIRQAIHALPLLTCEQLSSGGEYERAMLVLSMLGMSYVWGEPLERLQDEEKLDYTEFTFVINTPAKGPVVIPRVLAAPWVAVARHLDRPPILSHASIVLANWRLLDGASEVKLGNIALLNSFMGGLDEHWFFLATAALEAAGAPCLQLIVDSYACMETKDTSAIIKNMQTMRTHIQNMLATLNQMPIGNDPYIFYERVRTFLSGWAGNPLLPDGVVYEGEYNDEPQWFHGGSAAQSTIITSIDSFIGCQHESQFLADMVNYMPKPHRDFLHAIKTHSPSLLEYVVAENDSDGNVLVDEYNALVNELKVFRDRHIQIVFMYVVKQSKRSNEVGTGGTSIMPFLKQIRDETQRQTIGGGK